jgi:hypothetical protein
MKATNLIDEELRTFTSFKARKHAGQNDLAMIVVNFCLCEVNAERVDC